MYIERGRLTGRCGLLGPGLPRSRRHDESTRDDDRLLTDWLPTLPVACLSSDIGGVGECGDTDRSKNRNGELLGIECGLVVLKLGRC